MIIVFMYKNYYLIIYKLYNCQFFSSIIRISSVQVYKLYYYK